MKSALVGIACLLCLALSLVACGGGYSSSTDPKGCQKNISVDPLSATADHTAIAPGNQATFLASYIYTGPACPALPAMNGNVDATWTTSDTVNTTIAPQKTSIGTNGLATCTGATSTAATITATSPEGLKSMAALSCK